MQEIRNLERDGDRLLLQGFALVLVLVGWLFVCLKLTMKFTLPQSGNRSQGKEVGSYLSWKKRQTFRRNFQKQLKEMFPCL